jgi:hypothetical protein
MAEAKTTVLGSLRLWLCAAAACVACCLPFAAPSAAAEATTGAIAGTVDDPTGKPVAGAAVTATSPSGRYSAHTDDRGRFVILGMAPDSYAVSVTAGGFEPATESGVLILAGITRVMSVSLGTPLRTIGRIDVSARPFEIGSSSDSFAVSGSQALALTPAASSSGLANYAAGTVEGSVASVPGVEVDAFDNAILRGGTVDDTIYDYDSVPVPQGLIAEPGGNAVGAQLATTGIASTTVTQAGYETEGDNALGGVIDEIPAIGTYPASMRGEVADGISGTKYGRADFEALAATPDLRWRYAFSGSADDEYFSYGDGTTFYPAEAATFGLSLQTRGSYALAGNVHDAVSKSDDLSLVALVGQAAYDQYGSPYAGETVGEFDGAALSNPGETDPGADVAYASGVRGSYDVLKLQWQHDGAHSFSRVEAYQSQFGSAAGGPFWDENGYPDGAISLASRQGGREDGVGYDVDDGSHGRHHLKFGVEARVDGSFLSEVVPTADEMVESNPTLFSYLGYAGDTWSVSGPLDVTAAARVTETHVVPSDGFTYDLGALDPHAAASYLLGDGIALRTTFDHITVAPKSLETDRSVTIVGSGATPAPFAPLAPETANDYTASLEAGGRTQVRATYYADLEDNRIDVLPANFRSAVEAGTEPNGIGVPTNVGQLRAHGVDLWMGNGGFSLDANWIHALSSSASQFAFNDLNAPAVAAGHLFPVGYVPDVTVTASYEFDAEHGRLRFAPSLSFESGYPYGNGRMVYVFDGATGKPILVPNDNYVDKGANYYFLRDPSQPWNAISNPYIGDLGTPEGDDPNTLRSPPQMLLDLHVERDLSARTAAFIDIVNLLGEFKPTAYQTNPYLIGPPGYAGGNPLYAAAYQANAGFASPYVLGNGVPTDDGVHQSVPWTYGRSGYVPQSYPLGRTVQFGLSYRL